MKASSMLFSLCRLITVTLACLGAEGALDQSVPSISGRLFRSGPVGTHSLGVWEGDKPVLVYNYGSITNELAPKAQDHSSYLHPIYGLDGEVITGDFPPDHVYHRGLYWAWPHIKVGDAEYDLWGLRGIQPRFVRWLQRETDNDSIMFAVENGWFVRETKIMREELKVRVHRSGTTSRAIDLELSFTPLRNPITLWGAPGKSYGGLTFRFADHSKTIVTVPSGRAADDLLMAKLPWADLSGDFTRTRLSGAAVFAHPDHPAFPPEWMTRDYGVLAVGYPGVTPKTFAAEKTFILKYRIWVHRGAPEAKEIQRAYDLFRRQISP